MESFGKTRRNKAKKTKTFCSWAVPMAGASRVCKFVKTNLFRAEGANIYVVGLRLTFLRVFTTSFEFRAVDRSVFYPLSPGLGPPAQ